MIPPDPDAGVEADDARGWDAVFDALPDELAIYEGAEVVRANAAYASAAGIDRALLAGLPCHVARFGRDAPCFNCPLSVGNETAEAEVHARGRRFRVRASRLPRTDRPDAFVVSYRDVSDERQLEEAREAERLVAVGRLAGGIAHEINNPMAFVTASLRTLREHVRDLTSVAAMATLAADLAAEGKARAAVQALARIGRQATDLDVRSVAEDARQILDEAEAGAERVARIVEAMQGLAHEEVGEGEALDLAEVVTRAVERARRDGAPYPRVRWTRRDRVHVLGRPLQLDRAFYEIARNAGQAVGSADGAVRLSCRAEQGLAVVEIADNGVGIASADRPHIFEPFFTTRGVGGGVGLGLTVAHGVVERHGGAIGVASVPGKGTRIRIALPSTAPGPSGEDNARP